MIKKVLLLVTAALVATGLLNAAAFTPGSIVVYRIGDGTTALSAASAPVFLDEYSPAGVLIQSIALPTAASGSNQAFTSAGNATSEGYMNLALQGRYLVMDGYSAAPGTAAIAGTTASNVLRVLARVDVNGVADTSTTFNGTGANGNARSAAANDGTSPLMWIAGSSGGVQSVPNFGAVNANSAISTYLPTFECSRRFRRPALYYSTRVPALPARLRSGNGAAAPPLPRQHSSPHRPAHTDSSSRIWSSVRTRRGYALCGR